jgi:hypothetical protein
VARFAPDQQAEPRILAQHGLSGWGVSHPGFLTSHCDTPMQAVPAAARPMVIRPTPSQAPRGNPLMTPPCVIAGSPNGLCRGGRSHGTGGKPASFQNLSGAPDTTADMERVNRASVRSTIPVSLFRLLPRAARHVWQSGGRPSASPALPRHLRSRALSPFRLHPR